MQTHTMNQPVSTTRRWWNRRTKTLAWIAVGVLLPLCYLAWHIFGWPAPIRISYETTRLTTPLTPDGYVDFLRAYRESQPADIGDYRDDPWRALFENERDFMRSLDDPGWDRPHPPGTENIVYRHPVEALKEHLQKEKSAIEVYAEVHEFEENGLDLRMRVPFSASDDPVLAAVIEENEPWYDAVVATYKPTHLPVKFPEGSPLRGKQSLGNMSPEIHENCLELARRFRLRSMYRAGQGDLQGSFDELAFTVKIAARCDHCCAIATAVSTALELEASRAMVTLVLNSKELPPEFCIQIEQLPRNSTFNELAEMMDGTERHIWLDVIQGLYASQCKSQIQWTFSEIDSPSAMKYLHRRRIWHATNWNQVLIKQNEYFDAIVAALKLPTWREQHVAIEKRLRASTSAEDSRNFDIESAPPWSISDPTNSMTQMVLPKWGHDTLPELAHLRDLRRKVVQIAARLAMWRQLHGAFPDDLQAVLTVDGFSPASPTLLVDPFNELQLGYERQGNGFVLYSVGPNMQKDGSGFEECSIHDTDFSDNERPDDDHIWRWPLAD